MFTITQELEVISIKKIHPLLKQTHDFFLVYVYNFFVLILMKLQTPMITVIEQQGARIPGSIPMQFLSFKNFTYDITNHL